MAPSNTNHKPEIRVFAGPNGSGKSLLTLPEYIIPPYINADEIKKEKGCDDLTAAQIATAHREDALAKLQSFTFETVLSTPRNVDLLRRAKDQGYFIRCFFVLTVDPKLNVFRVKSRVVNGGHDVAVDKIISRYYRSLAYIPTLCSLCDRLNIYDNSFPRPVRIFKLRDGVKYIFPSPLWPKSAIEQLITDGSLPLQ